MTEVTGSRTDPRQGKVTVERKGQVEKNDMKVINNFPPSKIMPLLFYFDLLMGKRLLATFDLQKLSLFFKWRIRSLMT